MSDPKQVIPRLSPVTTELEALIAAAAMPSAGGVRRETDGTGRVYPARSIRDLEVATQAMSGWYQDALKHRLEASAPKRGSIISLDEIVKQHVAMRQEWEQKEAVSLAVWLTKTLSTTSLDPVCAPAAKDVPVPSMRRALLIDDSSDILVTVGAFLEAFGFAVSSASNSEGALSILAETPVELLVTDHAMPGMTGKELVLEALHQNPALRAMIITGYPDLQELRELPPHVTVLAKPFRRAELFARLQALFEPADQHDRTRAFTGDICTPTR